MSLGIESFSDGIQLAFIFRATRGAGWFGVIAAAILIGAYLWFRNKAD
jgi:hypothetical protein